MIFEIGTVRRINPEAAGFKGEPRCLRDHVDHMMEAKCDRHDRVVAECLGTAAAWAYSDVDTFARMMHRRGGMPHNETVSIRVTNNALLVDTTAFVTQSENKKLVLLTFSGTDWVNLVQLLLDVSSKTDQFWTVGTLHGGFFRAALALWPTVKRLLNSAIGGASICSGAEGERDEILRKCDLDGEAASERVGPDGEPRELCPAPPNDDKPPDSALYITGHSLGGALAVITAALIYQDPETKPIADCLRAIYTYGQPMVGSEDFAYGFQDIIGRRLFRHVYERDLIPRLPSRSAGSFQHIGTELYSADQGWLPRRTSSRQAYWLATSVLAGVAAFGLEQFPSIPLVSRLLSGRRMAVSLYDHLPINYLRTSMIAPHGSEFM